MAKVYIRERTVLKDYLTEVDGVRSYREVVERYEREIFAYTELSFATPRLLWHNPLWLEMERLTPLTAIAREDSVVYREPLWGLLQRVHEAGWWHRDLSVDNVVIHPERGPLLIDWEWLAPATSAVSYDLYGARRAGVKPAFRIKGDVNKDGACWALGGRSPNYWWKGL